MLFGRSSAAVFTTPEYLGNRQAHSEHKVEVAVKVRVSAFVRVQYLAREATPANRLRVAGALSLKGPKADVLFRRGADGLIDEGASPDVCEFVLLPRGSSLPIAERPIRNQDAESPLVWLSFIDQKEEPLSEAICVGRAEREPLHIDPLFEVPARVTLWISTRRSGRRGADLEISGELSFPEGITLRVALASGCNRFGAPADMMDATDVPVARPGGLIPLPPRGAVSDVDEHPYVSLALHQWNGGSIGSEIPVGWFTRLK